jgi:hypothetical protein
MAGQAEHRGTGRTGRTDERPTSGRSRAIRPPEIVPQAIDLEEQVRLGEPTEAQAPISVEAPLSPDFTPRTVGTLASYRLLTATGLTGAEAVGLIGYTVGLRSCEQQWTLDQVNRVLFLRELYESSDWGEAETQPA